MEVKADAILLRAVDYQENDKILTLFTAQYGKITASCKGVKKSAAKLKFAAQPFCFAEYVLAERNGRYTVTGATCYDGFYPLREDIVRFYAAASITELCNILLPEGIVNSTFFLSSVTALKNLCEGEIEEPLISFLLMAAKESGFELDLSVCRVCGKPLQGRLYFDLETGSFTCSACHVGTPASERTYQLLKKCSQLPYEEEKITPDAKKRALRLLKEYLMIKTECELKCLSELIRMI